MIQKFLALSLILIAGCASAIPLPTENDVSVAQERWQGTSLNDLQTGRNVYIQKCSGCHSLKPPESYSEQKWATIFPKMSQKAKLKKAESEYLKRYLLIISTRLYRQ